LRQVIVFGGHWTQTILVQQGLHGSTTHFFTTGPGMHRVSVTHSPQQTSTV
jgi:hypothetical protein